MAGSKNKSPASHPQTEPTAGEATSSASPATAEAETEEMVFTYNRNTGEVVRIEKVDQSGGRQELTEEEYAQFFGHGAQESEEQADQGVADQSAEAFAVAHQQLGFEQGYYHGLAEYEAALTTQAASGYSPEEEAAYHQGMADYHALVTGQA